jgi:propanol-preferring alcohol dehydrogenase
MQAAVVHAFGEPVRIEAVPVPTPGPGQILVNIKASGVCHTDLHAADGDWPVKPTLPFIPGHEGAGVRHLKGGDRVGVPWLYTVCGHREYCQTGWETLCHAQQNTGYSVNGNYAEYVLADPDYVGRLPDMVGLDEIAPILCAGVTVCKGTASRTPGPGNGSPFPGSAGSGMLRCNTRWRWDCTWPPSMSPRRSANSLGSWAPNWSSMPRAKIPPRRFAGRSAYW